NISHIHRAILSPQLRESASAPAFYKFSWSLSSRSEFKGVQTRDQGSQNGCHHERQRGSGDEQRPGIRPHRPKRHDNEENRDVEKVRKRGNALAPGVRQLGRHVASLDRLSRDSKETHEIEPCDRVA